MRIYVRPLPIATVLMVFAACCWSVLMRSQTSKPTRVPRKSIGHVQTRVGLTLETLSISPAIFRIHGFVNTSEAQHLAERAVEASITEDLAWSRTSDGKQSAVRTSRTAWIGRHFDNDYGAPDSGVVQSVISRAAALVGVNESLAEGVQVVRYPAHTHFRHHQDAHEPQDAEATFGGRNRLASILIYLNDAHFAVAGAERLLAGGETNFPHAKGLVRPAAHQPLVRPSEESDEPTDCNSYGLVVEPRAGDALLFYNLMDDQDDSAPTAMAVDHATVHAGCTVREGVKWAANIWLWDGRPPPRKLLYTLERSDGRVLNVEASGVEEARALAESL